MGVTDEDPLLVEAFIKRFKPTFPIVITGNAGFDKALGVQGFPTHAVRAPDGTLAYAGYSAESALSEALADARKEPLYPSKFGKIAASMHAGDVVKAFADLEKLVQGAAPDSPDADWNTRFRAWIEGRAASDLKAARAMAAEGRVQSAFALASPYAGAKAALSVTAEAATFVKELEARPAFADELKAGPLFDQAEALADGEEYTAAVEAYRKVYKKYGALPIGTLARTRAEKIKSDGLPGLNPACEDCAQAHKACEKHREDVKL